MFDSTPAAADVTYTADRVNVEAENAQFATKPAQNDTQIKYNQPQTRPRGVSNKGLRVKCNPLIHLERKRKRAQSIRQQSFALEKLKDKLRRKETKRLQKRRNYVKSMELRCKANYEIKKKHKLDQLKVKEWYIIQNELNTLAQKRMEMRKLNRVQKVLKKRIRNKEM